MDLLISYTKEDVREKEPWYTASGRAHFMEISTDISKRKNKKTKH